MRNTELYRKTNETEINLIINIDGSGVNSIDSGIGFLDHMLTLFSVHGRFDINLICHGDLNVDYHHTVEDVGICLGKAFKKLTADKKGMNRYGDYILPMDESLILTSVDFSGRSFLDYDVSFNSAKVGNFDTELVEEFWISFVRNADCSLHIRKLAGKNTHHIIEGIFKSAARSIKQAVSIDTLHPDILPSSKGLL